jgi:phospholipid/cholesterol/gamma-HCH transport system substrate-binding protein
VQIAGVKVGEVKSVEADGSNALITLSINPTYFDVHRDARIALRPHGLFGPKYIDLIPGTATAPSLHDGDTIQVNQTVQPVDLDQILKALQAPEQQNLKTAIVEFGKAAAGRGDDANHLILAADQLSAALDTPVKALDNVAPNLSNMLVQNEAFNASFSQTPLDQLVANNAVVMKAFANNADHLQSLLDHANSALTTLDQSLNGTSGDIRTIIETLGKEGGTIDQLNEFNRLIGLFAANLTGKDASVPINHDVTAGIIAAIENPRSAFASSDPCQPGPNHCGPDGREHYLRVQVFNEAGMGNALSQNSFPICLTKILNGAPGIPTSIPCPSSTSSSTSVPGAQMASDYGSLSVMLAA